MTDPRPPVRGRPRRAGHPSAGAASAIALLVATAILASIPARGGPEILREAYAPAAWDTSFANVWGNQPVAQSFVARTDFLVTHLDLYIFDQPETTGPDILQISVTADAGNRPGVVLGGTAKQGIQNWSWVSFGFYPWIPLTSGQRYWILSEDSQPRPKGYEWAMNSPGGYAAGEAEWYDANTGTWVNGTGADLFFRIYGISGPSVAIQMEPAVLPVDPGATVPLELFFNNTGNDVAGTVRIHLDLSEGIEYIADDASSEGGTQIAALRWRFDNVGVGTHRLIVWIRVEPDAAYYDGQSLPAYAFLNYTDASGTPQAPSWDGTSVTVLVPVIRAGVEPIPAHVAPGETLNFTVSFFNVGSGRAASLWVNATPGSDVTILGDDAASAGGTTLGAGRWLFADVSSQAYVFNVTARAAAAAGRGDRLVLRVDLVYTDGAGHLFASRWAEGMASIHGPSLVVEANADDPRPHPGDALRVLLYANNTGDENASRAWLNATLPSGAILEESTPYAGVRVGDRIAYELRDVVPGVLSIALRLRTPSTASPGTPLDVAADLSVEDAFGNRLRPSSATASATVVTPRFALAMESTRTAVSPGDPVDIVLVWNNTGNEPARRAWLNFTLPEKTLLVNSTVPWGFTNGTTYGWTFDDVAPGEGRLRLRIEVSARILDGEAIYARLDLRYERSDGVLSAATATDLRLEGDLPLGGLVGFELLFLWIAVLAAIFLFFLLLGYMDLLPHKRTLIDDVFLLHNSGILICHYSTTLRPDVDSDIASGMLMAVRNFVADALRTKNGHLQELKYGDHRIHMVHGRHAVLVTFTRGGNGRALEQRMAEVLRNIETAYESVLEEWSGRTEDFRGVEEHILRLVQG